MSSLSSITEIRNDIEYFIVRMKVLVAIIELVCKCNYVNAKTNHYLEIDRLKRKEIRLGKEHIFFHT